MRRWWQRVNEVLRMSTMDRAMFDFERYSSIRDRGFDHKQTMAELDRVWAQDHPELTLSGWPKSV